jgi:dihydroorotate dehydrogenase electron transfer subunit
MKIEDVFATVVSNIPLNDRFFILQLNSIILAESARPGNFLMLKQGCQTDPFLRRPFGIMDVDEDAHSVSIYYEVVGKATRMLAMMKAGDKIRVLGPLGNSFKNFSGKRILLIAGGRGIAPLFFTMNQLTKNNDVFLLYGARSSSELNLLDRIKRTDLNKVYYYTDDGSFGNQGLLTSDIENIIEQNRIQITLACGPEVMFKTLKDRIVKLVQENYISTEAYMGCGFGVCHSCVVLTNNGYKKSCSDGPIFKLEDLKW